MQNESAQKSEDLQLSLNKALSDSVKDYYEYGPRSSKKLLSLHGEISNQILEAKEDILVAGMGSISIPNELSVEGIVNRKNCDVTVIMPDQSIPVVAEIKFIMSSYKKNANNYLENMIGATANLQANGVKVSQVLIIPSKIPQVSKGVVKSVESLSNLEVDKYRRLMESHGELFVPDNLLFQIVKVWSDIPLNQEIPEPEEVTKFTEYKTLGLSDENISFLEKYSDYGHFLSRISEIIENDTL